MRIRLKKGVALFGTIAGAAVATILIVYNANQGNFVNVSDVDEADLIDLGGVLDVDQTTPSEEPSVVADASGTEAAVAAGLLGNDMGDKTDESDKTADDASKDGSVPFSPDPAGEEKDAALTDKADETTGSDEAYGAGSPGGYEAAEQEEVLTYVEVVPQTHSETVVSRRNVIVETPVTVTEQITVETDVTGEFHDRSEYAAEMEIGTDRRAEEAAAIQDRINKNLENNRGSHADPEYRTGDMVSDYGDDLIVFY